MAKPKFQIYADASGKYRWRLKDGAGEKVASSGDSYSSKADAKLAAQLVKGFAPDADIEE